MDRIYINNIFTYLYLTCDISNDHIILTKDVREPASSYYAGSRDNLHNIYISYI